MLHQIYDIYIIKDFKHNNGESGHQYFVKKQLCNPTDGTKEINNSAKPDPYLEAQTEVNFNGYYPNAGVQDSVCCYFCHKNVGPQGYAEPNQQLCRQTE